MRSEYDFSEGKRGAVRRATVGKTRITIRLDDDVLEWFRTRVREAGGGNYQTLINDALRTYVDHVEEPAEELLRRVIREELEPRIIGQLTGHLRAGCKTVGGSSMSPSRRTARSTLGVRPRRSPAPHSPKKRGERVPSPGRPLSVLGGEDAG